MRKTLLPIALTLLAVSLLTAADKPAGNTTAPAQPAQQEAVAPAQTTPAQPQEATHWLNTKSGIRHNQKCRYYGKGANGRPCQPTEGKACKICGG